MKSKLKAMKEEIKRLGALIKEKRPQYKDAQRKSDWDAQWKLGAEVGKAKYTVRHMGLAYGALRGVPRDVMEKPLEDNKPNEDVISAYIKEFTDEPEALCIGAG